jgi:hypothetical protein
MEESIQGEKEPELQEKVSNQEAMGRNRTSYVPKKGPVSSNAHQLKRTPHSRPTEFLLFASSSRAGGWGAMPVNSFHSEWGRGVCRETRRFSSTSSEYGGRKALWVVQRRKVLFHN